MLHYIKFCSDDRNITAVQEGLRHRKPSGKQGFLHTVFSVNLEETPKPRPSAELPSRNEYNEWQRVLGMFCHLYSTGNWKGPRWKGQCGAGHAHLCAAPPHTGLSPPQYKPFRAWRRVLLTLWAPGKRGPWGFFLSTYAWPSFSR